jgi:hypothetical protein
VEKNINGEENGENALQLCSFAWEWQFCETNLHNGKVAKPVFETGTIANFSLLKIYARCDMHSIHLPALISYGYIDQVIRDDESE